MKAFYGSFLMTIAVLVGALVWQGPEIAVLVLILGILEISLSFDNAVVNATILKRMSAFWQKLFLTVGILIAVVGMRLLFPIIIVAITAKTGAANRRSLPWRIKRVSCLHFMKLYVGVSTATKPAVSAIFFSINDKAIVPPNECPTIR